MINILLEGYNIAEPWLYDAIRAYLKPHHRVAVLALSFRDSRVKNLSDWLALYGRQNGRFYGGIVGVFGAYGIPEDSIAFVNCFADSREAARSKVEQADVLYFPGGLPDRMLERIKQMALYDVLANHRGIVMGDSAGAVLQLAEYHLSPDADYPAFGYYEGLGYLNDFYLQVHYEGTPVQNAAIQKVIAERGKPVYAAYCGKGALLVDDGAVRAIGKVEVFR